MARYEYHREISSSERIVVEADSEEDADSKMATILFYLPYNDEVIIENMYEVDSYDEGPQLCDDQDDDETAIPDNVQRKIDDYNNRNKS